MIEDKYSQRSSRDKLHGYSAIRHTTVCSSFARSPLPHAYVQGRYDPSQATMGSAPGSANLPPPRSCSAGAVAGEVALLIKDCLPKDAKSAGGGFRIRPARCPAPIESAVFVHADLT